MKSSITSDDLIQDSAKRREYLQIVEQDIRALYIDNMYTGTEDRNAALSILIALRYLYTPPTETVKVLTRPSWAEWQTGYFPGKEAKDAL